MLMVAVVLVVWISVVVPGTFNCPDGMLPIPSAVGGEVPPSAPGSEGGDNEIIWWYLIAKGGGASGNRWVLVY